MLRKAASKIKLKKKKGEKGDDNKMKLTSCKTSLARYLLSPSSTCGLFTLVTWPRSPGDKSDIGI